MESNLRICHEANNMPEAQVTTISNSSAILDNSSKQASRATKSGKIWLSYVEPLKNINIKTEAQGKLDGPLASSNGFKDVRQ